VLRGIEIFFKKSILLKLSKPIQHVFKYKHLKFREDRTSNNEIIKKNPTNYFDWSIHYTVVILLYFGKNVGVFDAVFYGKMSPT
jgi:hypothetical protein